MKLLFICGSLEPGKDGVGDYTRRLSAELIREGVSVTMLALNDHFLEKIDESLQECEGVQIDTLRLPQTLKRIEQTERAKVWVGAKNPDWISLQFVPYSFNKKGLPFGLARQLEKIGSNRKWQIMFHELWIGMSDRSSLKERVIGEVQRQILKRLILDLKANVLNTQTQLYLEQLKKMNFEADLTPLFSNICNFNKTRGDLKVFNVEQIKTKFELILFGSIHPEAPVDELVSNIECFFENFKSKAKVLTLVGRSGGEKKRWIESFKSAGFVINDLGEQSEEGISKALNSADIGITTTPVSLVEKSGTVIAMRMHGLPIVSVAKYWRPRKNIKISCNQDVLEFNGFNFKDIIGLRFMNIETNDIKQTLNSYLSFLNKKV